MIKPIKFIRLSSGGVIIERHKVNFYIATSASLKRLYCAVSNVMNQRYAPRITLFPGGFEVEY